jgi:hydrogenase/urease accessory protein HupE
VTATSFNAHLSSLFLLLLLLAWLTPPFVSSAVAHPLAPSLLEIVETIPGLAEVRWKTPLQQVPGAALNPRLPPLCLPSGEIRTTTVGTGSERRWEITCGAPLAGSVFAVDGIASSRASVILRVALADGRVFNTVLTTDQASFRVPEQESWWQVAHSYLRLGATHILTGPDHLLFVLGLMLLVVGRRRLLFTVTAFTAGHSVTLSLAVLGVVNVPSGPIEAAIAFSILVVAVELVREPGASPTLMQRYPWIMSFVFGLLHGLGFAGALAEIGLPVGEIPLALFSFNVGIEAGQLAFCALCLVPLVAFRRWDFTSLAVRTRMVAYPIGTLAAFWVFERAAATL